MREGDGRPMYKKIIVKKRQGSRASYGISIEGMKAASTGGGVMVLSFPNSIFIFSLDNYG